MTLSEEEKARLEDIVELQPTKNKVLQERWDMESGSEVHQYLEGTLKDYYYRDEKSLIRATAEAAQLVGMAPKGEGITVYMSDLERKVFRVVAGQDERSESVVSVLHKLHDEFDADAEVGEVRRALQTLKRKGIVEVIYRTVPTFRLTVDRDEVTIETGEDEADEEAAEGTT